jgi:hypothetical protein
VRTDGNDGSGSVETDGTQSFRLARYEASRRIATDIVLGFIRDDSNKRHFSDLAKTPESDATIDKHMAIRVLLLGRMGTIPLEKGSRMALVVGSIELVLQLTDWDQVVKELDSRDSPTQY